MQSLLSAFSTLDQQNKTIQPSRNTVIDKLCNTCIDNLNQLYDSDLAPFSDNIWGFVKKSGHLLTSTPNWSTPQYPFGTVRLDLARIAVEGGYGESGLAEHFSALTDALSPNEVITNVWNGIEFNVRLARHGSSYKLFARLPDTEISFYAVSDYKEKAPLIMIRFSPEWCWTHRLTDIVKKTHSLMDQLQINVRKVYPSRLDLCVDLLVSVSHVSKGQVTGYSMRGKGRAIHYFDSGVYTGFSNMTGGRKSQTYTVYHRSIKELEERARKGKVTNHERRLMAHGVSQSLPITRVELKANRERLTSGGISQMEDLTGRKIDRLWQWFSHKYLKMKHPETGEVTTQWGRLQNAVFDDTPVPRDVSEVSPEMHGKLPSKQQTRIGSRISTYSDSEHKSHSLIARSFTALSQAFRRLYTNISWP